MRAIWNFLNNHDYQPWTVIVSAHVIGLLGLYYLIFEFAWWMPFVVYGMWLVIGGIGVEVGLHTLFSHRGFKLVGQKVKAALGYLSVLGLQDTPIFWKSLHIGTHHPNADTPADLHSPVNGYWTSYIGWMFRKNHIERNMVVVRDLMRDPMHVWLHRNYFKIHWGTWIVAFALLGPKLACMILVLPALLALHQESIVNLVCHSRIPFFNYRNIETRDNSHNNWLLAWLVPWGLFLHNNHHGDPSAYHFDKKPYEIDIRRYLVPALVWLDRRIG